MLTRCARNCFDCPICTAQLSVVAMREASSRAGPWILNCNYCMWTSLDIGIKFGKPTNIRSQLDKTANGGKLRTVSRPSDSGDPSGRSSLAREALSLSTSPISPPPEADSSAAVLDPVTRFAALKSFYKVQITTCAAADPALQSTAADLAYSSPSSLARIMNLYSGSGSFIKKPKTKPLAMREALSPVEGLLVPDTTDTSVLLSKLQTAHSSNTTTRRQRLFQQGAGGGNPHARFVDELRPMPALLRTKRAKRCKACKHILVKPDFKPTSTRYRIRLLALNYIPLVSLKPVPGIATKDHGIEGENVVLRAGRAVQWILTLKNHLFDRVKVSLATPAIIPGKYAHKVTVLCPQFAIGPNSDVWDDALNLKGNTAAKISAGEQVAEAGKVYDTGRNWTSVVLEIVPVGVQGVVFDGQTGSGNTTVPDEDEDLLEIPVRVRLEWRQMDSDDGAGKESQANKNNGEEQEKAQRELAYWMVLGIGRVAP